MRKKIVLIFLFAFVFCLGFLGNAIITRIKKNQEPYIIKWGYREDGNIDWYTFNDKNGLTITGNYNPAGLESFSIYDDNKDYHQLTVFGKTYDGPIEAENPPEFNEIIEIDSFLTRSESINHHTINYYIDNTENLEIIRKEDKR